MKNHPTIAICGAGIAGVATAYYLLKKNPHLNVLLIDKQQPLSFTTSKSGENFRNYWPQEAMKQFVNHSIDLMEKLRMEHGQESFEMVYSGYNFISHHREKPIFGKHHDAATENDLEEITDSTTIQNSFPYLDKNIEKVVHIKKAGKIDVYAMGSLLLREAKKRGAIYVEGEILNIIKTNAIFEIHLANEKTIQVDQIVIAAGPFLNHLGGMLQLDFPVFNTLQHKFIIPDPQQLIPRNMPFTIYADAQSLDWTEEEAAFFAAEEKYHWLLQKFSGGLHIKPEGEGIKLGWAFQTQPQQPTWEIPTIDFFPQAVLKGASRFIPSLKAYENNIPSPLIEYGGYYTRTQENWPLIGPTKMKGVHVVGALAGFGTMSACAAGELCADYVLKIEKLPTYAAYFHPNRYEHPQIVKEIADLQSDGQL